MVAGVRLSDTPTAALAALAAALAETEHPDFECFNASLHERQAKSLLPSLTAADWELVPSGSLLDMARLREVVDEQAEDEGLWFHALTAPEAYLQQELRRLHAAVEAAARERVQAAEPGT